MPAGAEYLLRAALPSNASCSGTAPLSSCVGHRGPSGENEIGPTIMAAKCFAPASSKMSGRHLRMVRPLEHRAVSCLASSDPACSVPLIDAQAPVSGPCTCNRTLFDAAKPALIRHVVPPYRERSRNRNRTPADLFQASGDAKGAMTWSSVILIMPRAVPPLVNTRLVSCPTAIRAGPVSASSRACQTGAR